MTLLPAKMRYIDGGSRIGGDQAQDTSRRHGFQPLPGLEYRQRALKSRHVEFCIGEVVHPASPFIKAVTAARCRSSPCRQGSLGAVYCQAVKNWATLVIIGIESWMNKPDASKDFKPVPPGGASGKRRARATPKGRQLDPQCGQGHPRATGRGAAAARSAHRVSASCPGQVRLHRRQSSCGACFRNAHTDGGGL